MEVILAVANWALPLLYLSLVIDYGATFILRVRTSARNPWLLVVIALHAANLVLYGVLGGWDVLASPYVVPSVLALSMAVLYAIVELATHDRRTGVFVLALVFLLQYSTAIVFGRITESFAAPPSAQATWSRLHLLPAIFAYTALGFAGVYGLLYVLVARGLKQHRFGLLFDRLPPLELLGKMTWHALLTGFVFLNLAMASAPLMVYGQGDGQGAALDAKVITKIVTGVVAWLIYASAIVGRRFGRWPLNRIAGVAVVAFGIVLVLLAASGILS